MQSSGHIRTGHPARRTAKIPKAKGRHKAVAGTSSQGHIVGLIGIWQKLICIWREARGAIKIGYGDWKISGALKIPVPGGKRLSM